MNIVGKLSKEAGKLTKSVARAPTKVLGNTYVSAAVTLFLILYASLARPQLPVFIAKLFDNPLFRLLVLFGIAFMASRNFQVALLVSVAFTVTMNLLNEQKIVEGFMAQQYEIDVDITDNGEMEEMEEIEDVEEPLNDVDYM